MPVTLLFLLLLISPWISWSPVTAHTTITHLPGFDGPLPIELETGYVRVDELNEASLFYYFVKSERNPAGDPVLFWLTGGPGCSGISGLAFEIGPLRFDVPGYNGGLPSLFYDPRSWTKICNIIFLDSPVGTGFSYSRGLQGYQTTDLRTSRDVYTFIRKWFADHPEFLSNPLYIGGDSYSGLIVPIVAQEISYGVEGDVPLYNLQGYLVGNPGTDYKTDLGAQVPFAHGMGLISDELYEATKKSCGGEYAFPSSPQCAKDMESIHKCFKGVNYAHILEPQCFYLSPKPNHLAYRKSLLEHDGESQLSKSTLPLECKSSAYLLSHFWANNDTVREALGIQKGTIGSWRRCKNDLPYTNDVQSSVKYHFNVTSRGYRALVYSGDHDLFVPFVGTQAWIRSLNFSIQGDWRSWTVNGQVAGFTRTYSNNLTFATIKGAGHTAPEYRPKECLAMFQRWMSGDPL